jgi:catechol 2,3-dioxygenase-like lactoylglutathione lyase family enzyme
MYVNILARNDRAVLGPSTMILKSVDNVFFNTPDVPSLAAFYSRALGLPISRQTEIPCGTNDDRMFVIWAEILVGDLSLSFRKVGGTSVAHPEFREFEESPPASGVTIAFRVEDMSSARKVLSRRGVTFVGDVFSCTEGKELLSIFKDPWGRLLQLYEPRFRDDELESYYPHADCLQCQHGGIHSMRLAIRQQDLTGIQSFYSHILDLVPIAIQEDQICFALGDTLIEFTQTPPRFRTSSGIPSKSFPGVVPVFLSTDFESTRRALALDTQRDVIDESLEQCICFVDPDGNLAEIRPNPEGLKT